MRLKILASIAAALCAGQFTGAMATTLDFETFNNGIASSSGNLSGSEFTDLGVTLSSNKQLALFNSNCGPDHGNTCNSVGTDSDLATGASFDSTPEGQILIINSGSNANPNDDRRGGIFSFDFTDPVTFQNIRILDLDEHAFYNKLTLTFTYGDGSSEAFSGNADLAGRTTLLNPNFAGDNSVRDVSFGLGNVTEVDVRFNNMSGAIASIQYDRATAPVPLPSSVYMLAAGLGGLAYMRHRRRSA
ncbi:MAG: VPLPA-CTERM sorting domain-containing protein [Pseudomonadota bacterium]